MRKRREESEKGRMTNTDRDDQYLGKMAQKDGLDEK